MQVTLTHFGFDIYYLIRNLQTDESGAMDLFIGTARNKTNDKAVTGLFFEAYEPMALKELQIIVDKACTIWPINKVSVVHRLGEVKIGEPIVFVGVSTAHCKEAFEACRYIIDTLKLSVPIWKKELYADGSEWLSNVP